MNISKILLSALLIGFSLTVLAAGKNKIIISNSFSFPLKEKAISIKRSQFPGAIADGLYPFIRYAGGDVPSQLNDLNGDGKWDELFFVLDVPAKSSRKLSLKWVNQNLVYPVRTSVRFGKRSSATNPVKPATSDTFYARMLPKLIGYQPYQTDGPSWENDKVGFRHYFDGRNAKDMFGKKISAISPEDVGISDKGAVEDNYHVMKDWGRDIMPVGNSVGLGGLGLLTNGNLNRIGVTVDDTVPVIESADFKIVAEGPVKSIMDFKYNNFKADNGRIYQVHETPTIWPGMYAYQNTVDISGLKGDEQLVIGLAKVATDHPVTEYKTDKWVVLWTHDAQGYNKEFTIGFAIVLPADVYQDYGEAPKAGRFSASYYGKLKISEKKPLSYYAIGCWDMSVDKGFHDAVFFENYLKKFVNELSVDVGVKIK